MTSKAHTEGVVSSQLRGYGHPSEALDEALLSVTVEEYGRSIAQFFVEQHREQIASASNGLLESIEPWLDGDPLPGVAWDPAFGDLYRALVVGAGDERVRIVTSVAMHLACRGAPMSFTVDLEAPSRLRWGHLLLPAAHRLEVRSDGARAEVAASLDGVTERVRLVGPAPRWEAGGVEQLARLDRHGVAMTIYTQAQLDVKDFDELRIRAVDAIDPRVVAVFEEAVDIVREYAPIYLPWIQRPLHHLFLLRPVSHTIESGSVEHYLGLVHMSAHMEPLPVAELLVHEASHQYMNVAMKIEPLDDGTDSRLYWSPPVQRERPLRMILAGYHAFGNVLDFYRRCTAAGFPNEVECARQEELLGGWLQELVQPLAGNPALTDTGRGLVEPLREIL
jgi:HEXXH motif-containing protein